jgi:leucyl aminopeptidase (aminopeptidase T)
VSELRNAAETLLLKCMGAHAGESVLVVDDVRSNVVSIALIDAAAALGLEAIRMTMPPRERSGQEPPEAVAMAMHGADIVLIPTTWSLSHTRARTAACTAGARVASMPGITEAMFARTLTADYERVAERSRSVAAILNAGNNVQISSPLGTNLSFSIAGRSGTPDTGLYHTPGDFGNLPAGEAYLAPVEGTAEGTLVVDASMAGLGVLASPVTFTFSKGKVVAVEGEGAQQLRDNWAAAGKGADCVAELGVGTNDRAIITGKVLEDEKVLGTVHIALGNNAHFGGTCDVPYHADGVFTKPTLTVDGTIVIENGVPKF